MSAAFPLTANELESGRIVRVMSIARDEFFRMLPDAVDLPLILGGDVARGRGWTLRVEVQPALNIALLSLPRLRVEIEFPAPDPGHMRTFMASFDRHFQRGGG